MENSEKSHLDHSCPEGHGLSISLRNLIKINLMLLISAVVGFHLYVCKEEKCLFDLLHVI